MPTPAVVKASNASFSPSYLPVAIFAGGTSGVGQGYGRSICEICPGTCSHHYHRPQRARRRRYTRASPKTSGGEADGWKHEFVACDTTLMTNVRAACADIRAKCARINFLVLTAGYSSMVNIAVTSEGLDLHLAMRYYQRFVWIQELLPLIQAAQGRSEDAKVMSVLGAGLGSPKRPIDLENLGNTVKPRNGRFSVAMRSMIMSSGYTDAMLAHFATQNPDIAFTHIHPGIVNTNALRSTADFDGLLTPLSWILNFILPFFAVSQDECAEHMLYALFTGERGLFIRDRYGNAVSELAFEAPVELSENSDTSVLNGIPMVGYGASDLGVRRIAEHSEVVARAS
ncbi:hypothetical protein B0H14DRAFT_3560781 [Mycena olivaceomarginata]|nr:hypothetical protein B0H14DRAFT_3560781 [Mycena olivaceomarginata]